MSASAEYNPAGEEDAPMPVKPPPLAANRRWLARASPNKELDHRVWCDPGAGHEYDPDPRRNGNWHEIDPPAGLYRDVDPTTGEPVSGSEGRWRPLDQGKVRMDRSQPDTTSAETERWSP